MLVKTVIRSMLLGIILGSLLALITAPDKESQLKPIHSILTELGES